MSNEQDWVHRLANEYFETFRDVEGKPILKLKKKKNRKMKRLDAELSDDDDTCIELNSYTRPLPPIK